MIFKEIKLTLELLHTKKDIAATGEKIVVQNVISAVENLIYGTVRKPEYSWILEVNESLLSWNLLTTCSLNQVKHKSFQSIRSGTRSGKKITTSLIKLRSKLINAGIIPQITGLVRRIPINIPE